MLTPPQKGFAESVTTHNVRLDAMAEWLEGCITFVDTDVSQSDIGDILEEQYYYKSQSFAQEQIENVWIELKRRQKCLGAVCPYRVQSSRLVQQCNWADVPAYSFCLMLSLQVAYRGRFKQQSGSNYNEQGELFERLSHEVLLHLGWRTHSTGWSHNASNSIADKVDSLATVLGEPRIHGAVERWSPPQAKDGGLDVVCYLPFADGWSGRPIYFLQCASGDNWKDKLHTPRLAYWEKLLDLATKPKRGISHPFALLEDEFRRSANSDDLSLVLDRHRISRPHQGIVRGWVSPALKHDLNAWTNKRLDTLRSYIAN